MIRMNLDVVIEPTGPTQENVSSGLSGDSLELGSSFARPTPRWLIRALKARKTRTVQSVHEEMAVLIEAATATPTSMEIPSKMAYLEIDKQDDLISQIAIPPLNSEIDAMAIADFKIEQITLGKPTKDIAEALATLGIKKIFT